MAKDPKVKVADVGISTMTAEELQKIVEGSTEKVQGELKMPEVLLGEGTPVSKVTYGSIEMPSALLVGTQRTTYKPNVIATGVSLEIPEGGYAIIGLSNELASKTRIRLAGNILLLPEESRKEVMIVIENHGLDAFMIPKGMPLVSYVIVNG